MMMTCAMNNQMMTGASANFAEAAFSCNHTSGSAMSANNSMTLILGAIMIMASILFVSLLLISGIVVSILVLLALFLVGRSEYLYKSHLSLNLPV